MTKKWLSLVLVLTLIASLFTGTAMAAPVMKGTKPVITFEPKAPVITATKASQVFPNYELGTFKSDGGAITGYAANQALATALGTNAIKIASANVTSYGVSEGKLYATFTGPAAVNTTSSIAFGAVSEASYDFTQITSKPIALVECPNPVTRVTVSPSAPEIVGKGGDTELTAVVYAGVAVEADDVLTWSSSDEKVATVASAQTPYRTATVTAVDAGTAVITAKTSNGRTTTATVTVKPVAASGIYILQADTATTTAPNATLAAQSLKLGEVLRLKGYVKTPVNATSTTFTWSSGNTAAATIDANGVVTPVAVGTAVITATSANGTKQTVSVTVAPKDATPTVTDVKFSLGATHTEAKNYFSTEKELTLVCDTADAKIYYILTADDLGGSAAAPAAPTQITGIPYSGPIKLDENKRYLISAIAFKDGYTAATAVNVEYGVDIALKELKLTPETVTVKGADKTVLTAQPIPANANVTLTATAPDAGYFTQADCKFDATTGKWTLVTNGTPGAQTVTLTPSKAYSASVNNGSANTAVKPATAKIVISEEPATGITASPAQIMLGEGEQVLLKGIVTPTTATNKVVTYSISSTDEYIDLVGATEVAPIKSLTGSNGVQVKGVAAGTSMVYLTASNGTRITCPVTVTAKSKQVATPVIKAKDGNNFTKTTDKVEITCSTVLTDASKLKIYYTLDGTKPTTSSTEYSAAFGITANADTIVRAIAVDTTVTKPLNPSQEASATFTSAIAVSGVTLDKTKTTIKGLGEDTLTASFVTVSGTAPKNQAIVWTTSNDKVVTVAADKATAKTDNPKAIVTAVASGNAVITATTEDGAFTATCKVSVTTLVPQFVCITGQTVDNRTACTGTDNTATVAQEDTLQLSAKFLNQANFSGAVEMFPNNKEVTWTSSNANIATIDATGLVKGIATGEAIITATSKAVPAVKTYVTLTVDAKSLAVETPTFKYTSATVTTAAPLLATKYTEEIKVQVKSTTGDANFFYTTDGSVPTASSTKYDSAKGIKLDSKCTLNVLATKTGLRDAVAYATFDFAIPVTEIKLDKVYQAVSKGQTVQLNVTYKPTNATNKTIVWTTGNSDIATVSDTGLVTAKGIGETTITATPSAGLAKTFSIKVAAAVATGMSVTPTSLSMSVNEVKGLVATVTPIDASNTNVTWISSSYAIASVDSNGVVTALKAGTATITAKCGDVSASCSVSVKDNPKDQKEPLNIPSFKPTITEFSVPENGSINQVIGQFVPGTGETWAQISAYYDVRFTSEVGKINVDDNGVVTLYAGNVGNVDKLFKYDWTMNWKYAQGTVAGKLNGSGRTLTGNKLIITLKPNAVLFTALTMADIEMKDTEAKTVDMGTVTNYAEFKKTGVSVTATLNAVPVVDPAPKAAAQLGTVSI
ncbi:MAG: Ig-like domain-containing protein, partial [Clostridia bacterium]